MRTPGRRTHGGVAAAGVLLAGAISLAAAAQEASWESARSGRILTLPRDHASHPEYKLEWWYYTGNLDDTRGRRFGYQLTFFRVGIDAAPENRSRWAVRDLYMTHLALTDVSGRQYRFSERLNRSGPGWAGAASDTYKVWNEDWQATRDSAGVHHLQAALPGFGIRLRVQEDRPVVLHGNHGYSRKGAAAGNASHYYSFTRMPTRGTITIDGQAIEVTGQSWMDHEFGTSFLEPEQTGWDWFSIQLDDGRDLMIFQLRRSDGTIDPRSAGTLVDADGSATPVTLESGFRLEPGRSWKSPATGARYPVAWLVHVPQSGIELSISATLEDQELHAARSSGVAYWEGAVDVTGTVKGRPVKGRGYLEMTGYSGASIGRLMR